MFKLYKICSERLWVKILVPVSLIVICLVSINLWANLKFQTEMGNNQLKIQNRMLSKVVQGSMFDALAVGDNDTVRMQFKRLAGETDNLKVFVYDFNGDISFSTDEAAVGKNLASFIGEAPSADLSAMLESGKDSGQSFHNELNGHPFLLENNAILNEQGCFHCHGQSKKVLGGVSVFSSEKAIQEAVKKGEFNSSVIGLTGLIVVILCIWFFFQFMVNRKIHLVLNATDRLRKKDFTGSCDVGDGDEINHILARIHLVTQDLGQTIKTIRSGSQEILDRSAQLNQISETLNDTSRDSCEKTMSVSAAAEEMSSNNQAVAHSMEESAASLNSIASAVEEMTATVGEISKSVASSMQITNQVATEFDMIRQEVEELGVRAGDVDAVTQEIKSIAGQVHLLALNAKIEAARAGDQGKGFAVVAQEITELASESNNSALDAGEKLQWIKDKTTDVTMKVTELSEIIKASEDAISSISAAVEEQDATTREISRNISNVSGEVETVNTNVTEGALVASGIAAEIATVEQGAKEVESGSGRLNESATSLSKLAEEFMGLINAFKVE